MKANHKIAVLIASVILVAAANIAISRFYISDNVPGKPENESRQFFAEKKEITDQNSSFAALPLEAKAGLVMRISDKKLIFEKNADLPFPLASLSKLMTAYVAEKIKGKQDAFDVIVPITAEAINQEGDSGFQQGDAFRAEALRDIMLLGSSNDAAFALAEKLGEHINSKGNNNFNSAETFVYKMNEEARNLGFRSFYFLNSTGLDVSSTTAGGLGSANDLAELTLVILKDYSHIFEITSKSEAEFFSENGSLYKIKNTNKLISEIASFIAGKTGYSDLAGGNLLIVADMGFNDPYLFVILGSSYEGRFEDVKKLYYAVKGLSF